MTSNNLVQSALDRSYLGRSSALVEKINASKMLIVESGVVGGDLLPRRAMEPTRKKLQETLEEIAERNGDTVEVQFVGSTNYGAGGAINKSFFGDIDVVLHVGKPETLSQIKQWAMENAENVRDIKSRKSGDDLSVENLGDQFSFLFPMYKDSDQHVTIGELRFALDSHMGNTTWKSHHDERMKVQSNLDNLKDKRGVAKVQIDIIRSVVDGQTMEELMKQARSLADRFDSITTDDLDDLSDYKAWLGKFLDQGEVEDFDSHYEYLKRHGQLQSKEDQRTLAALHALASEENAKELVNSRVKSTSFRYSFHPDALQMVHYIAAQLGERMDDDDFSKSGLEQLIKRAEGAGILKEPKTEKTDGTKMSPVEIKRMTVEMLRDPSSLNDAMGFFMGKHRDGVRRAIASGTRRKRVNEKNPNALFRNYGSRNIMRM